MHTTTSMMMINETLRMVAAIRAFRRYNHHNHRLLAMLEDGWPQSDDYGYANQLSMVGNSLLDQQTYNESEPTLLANGSTDVLSNEDTEDDDGELMVKICFYLVYLVIFVLGLVGNALICYVVARNSTMHTVTNVFIANLALSDILLCLFAVPFTWLYLVVYEHWIFGKILCHLLPFAQGWWLLAHDRHVLNFNLCPHLPPGVSVYISTLTLMSIAFDRYFVILYPFRPRMPMRICLLIIVAIWVLSCLLMTPYAIFMRIDQHPDEASIFYCQENWPNEETKKMFGLFTCIMQFLVPFLIITICYYQICSKLWDRAKAIPGNVSARREEAERERTRRTNWMLISMVVIFVVSWLPLNIFNLLVDFFNHSEFYSMNMFLVVHAVAMASTCYNPFLYAWLNENFRKEFKDILPCCFRLRAPRLPTTIVQYRRKPRSITVCRDDRKGVSVRLTPAEEERLNGTNGPRPAIATTTLLTTTTKDNGDNNGCHTKQQQHQKQQHNFDNEKSASNSTSKAESTGQMTSDSPLP